MKIFSELFLKETDYAVKSSSKEGQDFRIFLKKHQYFFFLKGVTKGRCAFTKNLKLR